MVGDVHQTKGGGEDSAAVVCAPATHARKRGGNKVVTEDEACVKRTQSRADIRKALDFTKQILCFYSLVAGSSTTAMLFAQRLLIWRTFLVQCGVWGMMRSMLSLPCANLTLAIAWLSRATFL
jgi:hypothetical protein